MRSRLSLAGVLFALAVSPTRSVASPVTVPPFFVAGSGPDVRFQASWSGGTILVTSSEIVVVSAEDAPEAAEPASARSLDATARGDARPGASRRLQVRRLRFDGANPNAAVVGEGRLPGIVNVFRGADPAAWRTRMPTFERVVFRDLWPGVDLALAFHGDALEGRFAAAPGTDTSRVAWQWIDAGRRASAAGAGASRLRDGALGFALAPASAVAKALVAGPSPLLYASFLGGNGDDIAYAVAASGGIVTLTGFTKSPDFPTLGAIDSTCGTDGTCDAGYADVFVAKLDPSKAGAAQLVYATYLGGSGNDYSNRVTVDASGAAYVAGLARTGFPTTANAWQPAFGSASGTGSDVFLSKLSPDGASLLYSTYFGGSSGDGAWGLATDDAGGAWLTGQTYSANFPVTAGAYQAACTGCNGTTIGHAFAAKFDTSKSGAASLVFSTLLGGTAVDQGFGLALGPSQTVYVAGRTTSTDFPTVGAYQAVQGSAGADNDAFVAKLSADGSSLLYSTYLGGSGYEDAYSIAVDASGAANVAGGTGSAAFPTTASAFQGTFGGSTDAWFARINPAVAGAGSLLYATFLGGGGADAAFGVALDAAGTAWVAGYTSSADLPVTPCRFQALNGGGYDAFLVRIDPAATGAASLLWSTYFGGGNTDAAYGLALDTLGNAFIAGQASSTNLPTANAYSASPHSATDAFVAKLTPANTTPTPTAGNTGPVCDGQFLQLTAAYIAGATYSWTGPNGFTSTLQSPTISPAAPAAAGAYTVTATNGSCASSSSTTTVVVNPVPATPAVSAPALVGAGSPNRIASVPNHAGSSYGWSIANGTITAGDGTSQVSFTAGTPGPLTLTATEFNASGCASAAGTADVTVAPPASAILFETLPPCRVLDTRGAAGPLGSPALQPGAARIFAVAGTCGIPADAKSISANVTVTEPAATGNLVIHPGDGTRPSTNSLSFRAGQTRANNALLKLADDGSGTIAVFANTAGTAHLVLDVNGYFR